jgi:hypothetical protein
MIVVIMGDSVHLGAQDTEAQAGLGAWIMEI